VRTAIGSATLIEQFRVSLPDWTRRRKLWIDLVICLILRGHKMSIQTAINKVFTALGLTAQIPTKSALRQARAKLKAEVFLHLNTLVVDEFYQAWGEEELVQRFRGFRVVGIDATRLHVPDTPETRDEFTLQANQHPGAECVQAMLSVSFDVLNAVGLRAGLRAICAEKEFIFADHAEALTTTDLVVLDRTYVDYGLMAWLEARVGAFVIRCPNSGFARIKAFFASDEQEAVVELEMPTKATAFISEQRLRRRLRVRLVKVVLETGEVEVLVTNLFEQEGYSRDDLKQVYWMRWGIETYYGHLKRIFEVERLGGSSVRMIQQSVYGIVFLATLESVLSKEADRELAAESVARDHVHRKQVNHAVSYSAMLDHAIDLLSDRRLSAGQAFEQVHALFRTDPSSARPGRTVQRHKVSWSRQLRHHKYKKRLNI
jgi:Transposase DDE domain